MSKICCLSLEIITPPILLLPVAKDIIKKIRIASVGFNMNANKGAEVASLFSFNQPRNPSNLNVFNLVMCKGLA